MAHRTMLFAQVSIVLAMASALACSSSNPEEETSDSVDIASALRNAKTCRRVKCGKNYHCEMRGRGFGFRSPAVPVCIRNPSEPDGGTPPPAPPACSTEHAGKTADGESVTICDAVFAERPFVRPPADTLAAEGEISTIYAAISSIGDLNIVDRRGINYTVVDSDNQPISGTDTTSPTVQALRMPSNRNLYTIYKIQGVVQTYKDPDDNPLPAIRIVHSAPAILLDGRAIDGAYLGAWEGTVSLRLTDTRWDRDTRVPIRIKLSTLTPVKNLTVWNATDAPLADGTIFQMTGVIDNFDKSVRGAHGECFPALSSLGSGNPFAGATATTPVSIERMPAMHRREDREMVFNYPNGTLGLGLNGMTHMTLLHPANFLQNEARDEWTEMLFFPHGSPNGHDLRIVPVGAGGGDECTP